MREIGIAVGAATAALFLMLIAGCLVLVGWAAMIVRPTVMTFMILVLRRRIRHWSVGELV